MVEAKARDNDQVLLVAEDLVKSFRSGDLTHPVVRGVSLTVRSGEWIAVMGPSGCGHGELRRCPTGAGAR